MLTDPVTNNAMQAASLLTGATMAGFLVARLIWRRTPMLQFIIVGVYFVSVLGFILYYTL
ncbi:hypothetical protein [Rhodopila globiformis]|uniref:Uncharacterized protein n=1 Tax=Rhodopila globiformis TaxID=1071 RepID=A0A2S6NIM1_RHOGL|nr:hypothetical protein [Rhodopila globiformis]PPQ34503.1 hypothetical protein CCS01_10675 [Rhodopila globiformis]